MKEYVCIKCNKKFGQKIHYTNHINRKTSCIKPDESDIKTIMGEINSLKLEMKT